MKKILIIGLLAVSFYSYAQVDRSKAPKPAPAREIKIGDYQSFTLKNGLEVFVVENHKLPRVQLSVQLKNDPILEGSKAGYVSMAGSLLGTATTTRTKAQLDEEIDFIGATINTNATGMFASSLTKHSGKLLELATDILFNPVFTQAEMDKLRTQTLSALAASKDNPNAIGGNVRRALVYGKNHTYGELTTEETVKSITLDDCKNYYNTYFKPNNAYLIIIGDIDLKGAKVLAEKYFSKWSSGEVKNPTYGQPQAPAKTVVALVDRPSSVQSVINISYPLDLRVGTQEAIKARVVNQILGVGFSSRFNQNLREKKGFTYGAGSTLSSDNLIGNFNASASVRNEVTDSAVFEFLSEMKRIANEPVTEQELSAAKAAIAGAFGRSLESPQTLAGFAVTSAKYNLPKDYYNNYLKSIDAVTIADVQATAKKYIRPENSYVIVVGKGSDVAEKLKKFGEVKYYDVQGNNYIPSKSSDLPTGLTAEKVLADYIRAVGGDKVKEVKDLKMVFKGNAMGTELTLNLVQKAPGKSLKEITANGMTFSKSVSDGKDAMVMAMGQKPAIESKMKELLTFDGALFREINPAAYGAKPVLKGIETIDSKEVYVIEFQLSQGEKITDYFSKESGLKVQTLQTMKGPQGEVSVVVKYDNYKEVKGVKIPHTMSQAQGPMNLKFDAASVDINTNVDDTLFKMQ